MTDRNQDNQSATALVLTKAQQTNIVAAPKEVSHFVGLTGFSFNDITDEMLDVIANELHHTITTPLLSALAKIEAAGTHEPHEQDEFSRKIAQKYWCADYERYAFLAKNYRGERTRHDLDYFDYAFLSHFNPRRHHPTPESYVLDYVAERAPHILDRLELYEGTVEIPEKNRALHTHIVGTTGAGKSGLIETLVYSHLTQQPDAALVIIDPIGDMANHILHWEHWAEHGDRLAFISPKQFGDSNPILNPLECPEGTDVSDFVSMVIGEIGTIVTKEGSDDITGHMETMLRHCLTVLLDNDCADFQALHAFTGVQEQAKPYVDMGKGNADPFVSDFFKHNFESSSRRATREALHNRLESILSDKTARQIFNGKSTVDLEALLDEKKVIVFSLGKGRLGKSTTLTIGQSILGRLHAYGQRRQKIPEHQRGKVHVFLDEAQNYMSPILAANLEELRKFKICFTIAHLHTKQLGQIADSVTQMTDVKLALRHQAPDHALAAQFNIKASALTKMKRFTAYGKWGDAKTAELFTLDDAVFSVPTLDAPALDRLIASQVEKYYTTTAQPPQIPSKPTRKRELL